MQRHEIIKWHDVLNEVNISISVWPECRARVGNYRRDGRASHSYIIQGLVNQDKEIKLVLMGNTKPVKDSKQERKVIRFYFGIITLVVI